MDSLTVYGVIVSQPTRNVIVYLKLAKIPFSLKEIRLSAKENESAEFLKINPFGTIPALVHGDYSLWESSAIVTYVSEAFDLDIPWYPKDFKIRGRINAYMHWHHLGVRENISKYLYPKLINPKRRGAPELTEEQELPIRTQFLSFLEDFKWLINETGCVARTADLTIADVFAYNEFTLAKLLFEITEYPEISCWFNKIEAVPEIKEVTDQAMKIVAEAMR